MKKARDREKKGKEEMRRVGKRNSKKVLMNSLKRMSRKKNLSLKKLKSLQRKEND